MIDPTVNFSCPECLSREVARRFGEIEALDRQIERMEEEAAELTQEIDVLTALWKKAYEASRRDTDDDGEEDLAPAGLAAMFG